MLRADYTSSNCCFGLELSGSHSLSFQHMLLAFIGLSCGCEPLKPLKNNPVGKNWGKGTTHPRLEDTGMPAALCVQLSRFSH